MIAGFRVFVSLGLLPLSLAACQLFLEVPSQFQSTKSPGNISDNFNEEPVEDPTLTNLNLGSVTNLGSDDTEIIQSNTSRANQPSPFDARTATGRVVRLDFNVPQEYNPDITTVRIIRWGPFNRPEDFSNQLDHIPQYRCDGIPSTLAVSGSVPIKIGPRLNNVVSDFEFSSGQSINPRTLNQGKAWLDGDKNFNSITETDETLILHDRWYVYLFCMGERTSSTSVNWLEKRIRTIYALDGYSFPSLQDKRSNGTYIHYDLANTLLAESRFDLPSRDRPPTCATNRSRNLWLYIDPTNPDSTIGPVEGYTGVRFQQVPSVSETFSLRTVTFKSGDNYEFIGPDDSPGVVNASNAATITTVPIIFSASLSAESVLQSLKTAQPVILPFSTKEAPNNSNNPNTTQKDLYGENITTQTFGVAIELFIKDLAISKRFLFDSFGSNTIFNGSSLDPVNLRGFSNTSNSSYFSGGRALRFKITNITRCN